MARLYELYRISDHNLGLRRTFIGFAAEDIAALRGAAPWAEKVGDRIAARFYDHQFSFAPTVEFFEAQARRKGVTMPQLREALERTQSEFFKAIFREAARGGSFGAEFFEGRLRVGRMHNLMNLPLKWYLGSYALLMDLVREELTSAYRLQGRKRDRLERAIFLAFNFDMQAVTEAFYFDTFAGMGIPLDTIDVDRADHDLSDRGALLKQTVLDSLIELDRAATQLSDTSASLDSAAEQTGFAVAQIATTMQQVAGGAADQARSAADTAQAIETLSALIGAVGDGATQTAANVEEASSVVAAFTTALDEASSATAEVGEAADQAAAAARNGAAAVADTVGAMDRIRASATLAATRVSELGAKSSEIGRIVETIDDIAEQTNLLALNAAIEAARAGEMGKGFAVVADEVRKLAERSSRATKEIGTLIASIQQGTDEAVAAMSAGAADVEQGASLAAQSGEALAAIRTAAAATDAAVERIGAAVDQMTVASTGVVIAMDVIATIAGETGSGADGMRSNAAAVTESIDAVAAVSQENSAAAEEVSAATEEMTAQVEQLTGDATELARMANGLREVVGRFDLEQARQAAGFTALDGGRAGTPETPREKAVRRAARAAANASAPESRKLHVA